GGDHVVRRAVQRVYRAAWRPRVAKHRAAMASLAEHGDSFVEQCRNRHFPTRRPAQRSSEYEALVGRGRDVGFRVLDRSARRLASTRARGCVCAFDAAEWFLLHSYRSSWFASARRRRRFGRRLWKSPEEPVDRFQLRASETMRDVLACGGWALD